MQVMRKNWVYTIHDPLDNGIWRPRYRIEVGMSNMPRLFFLHLGFDILKEGLKLIHVSLLLGPADAQTLCLVGLWDLREALARERELPRRNATM